MYLKLLFSFVFFLVFSALPCNAMKRLQSDEAQEVYRPEKSNLLSKNAFDDINWYDYVEFLSKIYNIKTLSLKEKLESLRESVFTRVNIHENKEKYSAWVTMPDGKDIIINLTTNDNGYNLVINNCENYHDNYKCSQVYAAKIIFENNQEKIQPILLVDISKNFPVQNLVYELLNVPPSGEAVVKNNKLSNEDFILLLEKVGGQSFIQKMFTLNNGNLKILMPNDSKNNIEHNLNLQVNVKNNVRLKINTWLESYNSNTFAEDNFLNYEYNINPGTLLYYNISFTAWDFGKNKWSDATCFEAFFPLDFGYGKINLPCELSKIHSEKNLCGKEVLEIVERVLYALQPKIIYLHDDAMRSTSSGQEFGIRVVRCLAGERSFYEQYAGFQVVDCQGLYDYKNRQINQSVASFNESLKVIREYKIKDFLKIVIAKQKEKLGKIVKINNIEDDDNLQDLFNKLYRDKSENDLAFIYSLVMDENFIFLSAKKFTKNMTTIAFTFLWKNEKYQKKFS